MIIAQITDLHVVPEGQLCQGRVPTYAQLQEAVAHINSLDPRPDVVLVTGDLTDHGTLALTEANGFDFEYALEPRAIQLYASIPERAAAP